MPSGLITQQRLQQSAANSAQSCVFELGNTVGQVVISITFSAIPTIAVTCSITDEENRQYWGPIAISQSQVIIILSQTESGVILTTLGGLGHSISVNGLRRMLDPRPNRLTIDLGPAGAGIVSQVQTFVESVN